MGVVIPPSFAQLTWFGFHGAIGQEWACTMGVDTVGGVDALELAELGWEAWFDNLLGRQSSSTALVGCRAKLGPNVSGNMAEFLQTEAGAIDAATVPSNCAVLVHKHTASGGRANRGRMFVPGIPEGQVLNTGAIDPAIVTIWNTHLDDFQGQLVTSLLVDTLVVLHDSSSPVTTPTVITQLRADAVLATQRRRLRR